LQGRRVYLTSGDAVTQCSGSGGGGGKTGLYLIDQNPNPQITDNARCITARQDSGLIGPEGSGTLLNACLDVINGFLFGSLLGILIAVMMGYSVIKVFFASIKRGGILLIQIAIGSLYMFSVPRGFNDGFVMWVKQVIATCLTAFLQSTMLVCGLILFKDYWLLGLGIMLAAGEIPRIAGMFGLETSVRPNINGVINTAQSAVHLKQMVTAVAKK